MRRRDRFYAWLRARPIVPDAVIACGLFLVLAAPSALVLDPGWPHIALGVAMYGALAVRRIFPVVSFAVVAVIGLIQWAAAIDLTAADAGILVALYSISAYGPLWASRMGLVVGVLGAVLASQRFVLVQGGTGASVAAAGMLGAAVVGVWAFGDARRVRQAYVAGLVERAKQAERERDQQAQIAAAAERARIARDMHDVIAHNLSVIVAQADGGRYATENDPSRAAGVLDTIASTGRSALAEMRRLLGILRSSDDPDESRMPQPGLADVPELVASYQSAGLSVDVEVDGERQTIGRGPSLAMYRAIQEALTNVLKHAGPDARATVRVRYDGEKIEAHVTDSGAVSSDQPPGAGHGLAGMRERLALYGADVTAGPGPDGAWRVAITMPSEAGRS